VNKEQLSKLRAFVQTRLESGIFPEILSLDLLSSLPPEVLTRALFKDLELPWMTLPANMKALSSSVPFNAPMTPEQLSKAIDHELDPLSHLTIPRSSSSSDD